MTILSMSCSSCGAPLKIPADIDHLNCAHCGTALIVQRGEGYVALRVAEQLSKAIDDAAQQTQATIVDSSQETKAELEKIRLTQEVTAAQTGLADVRAQIRALESGRKSRKVKRELNSLYEEEAKIQNRINRIMLELNPGQNTPLQSAMGKANTSFTETPWKMGCLWGFLVFFIVGVILVGNLGDIGMYLGVIAGIVAGIIVRNRVAKD